MRHWINGKDPRQYEFDFGLWTRQIVAALIEQRFGVRLRVTAVGRLLARLDITPQKPLASGLRARPGRDRTLDKEGVHPGFALGEARRSQDLFLDEAGVRSDQVLGRTSALRGRRQRSRPADGARA